MTTEQKVLNAANGQIKNALKLLKGLELNETGEYIVEHLEAFADNQNEWT